MSARGTFIAGTDTGVGKTRTTVALLRALNKQGIRASGMKPVASGLSAQGVNEDVALIRAASSLSDSDDLNCYCFEWPISAHLAAHRAGVTIELERITAAYARLASRCDAIVVEGTGGWLAPIGAHHTMADVAAALGLPVVLVVGLRLGCLSHALLTARAIAADGLPLAGWIGSVIDPSMLALNENIATLEHRLAARCLGLLPFSVDGRWDDAALAEAAKLVRDGPHAAQSAERRADLSP